MTNTQRLEQGIPRMVESAELARTLIAVVQQVERAAVAVWNELRQWG